jgi:hypothetical protein
MICVTSSGIAVLLLPGGITAHSRFKIPLKLEPTSTCPISKGSNLARLIVKATLIIWDEVPMTNKLTFEAVNRTLRDLYGNADTPFNGKPFLSSGDFI